MMSVRKFECAGRIASPATTYDTTLYPDLYAVLGTNTLPNMHHRFPEGTTSIGEVGQTVEAGLPNIQGAFTTIDKKDYETPQNAFALGWTQENKIAVGGEIGANFREEWITFDASRSSTLFGASDTNQPKSLRGYLLIRYQ